MPYPKYDLTVAMLAGSVFVLLLISGALIYFRRKTPALLFGWLWYLGMLLPVTGAIRFLGAARADRFVYLPFIGLSILLVWGASRLPVLKRYGKPAACVLLVIFALAANLQTRCWRNNLTLWTRALEVAGPSTIAYINLGIAFCEANEPASAETCFQRTLQLDPNDQEALYNLGLLRVSNNRMTEGENYLQQVLALNPDRFDANKTLGAVYIAQKKYEAGIEHTLKALRIHPEDPGALKNLKLANKLLAEKQNRAP
jgi:tetratricopeptide (TPR) repeat protein